MYVASLLVCLLGNWRSNALELAYFAVDSLATIALHGCVLYSGGWRGLLYLVLSMAFGNGFLMHPLIGFWLMQHLCHASPVPAEAAHTTSKGGGADGPTTERKPEYISMQPTVSYDGWWVWNLLNFNQLSHVEHHDFSTIPWTKANQLRAAAPEFYGEAGSRGVQSITSLRALLWHWVITKGDKMNFACILANAPSLAKKSDGATTGLKKSKEN